MAGFATYDSLKAAHDAGQRYYYEFYQSTGSAENTATLTTSWASGTRPAAGANPATTPGDVYTNTAGGIIFPDLNGVGKNKYLYLVSAEIDGNSSPGSVFICDRLVGVGGVSLSSTGDKTINTQALTRYTTGEAVMAFLEITTTTATSAPVVSLASYTNQDGTNTRAGGTITFPAAATNAGSVIGPLPLQAGDTGIRSVETLNVGTAGTAGVCNLILAYKLASIGVNNGDRTTQISPLPYALMERVYDGATLFIMTIGYSGVEVVAGEVGVVFN